MLKNNQILPPLCLILTMMACDSPSRPQLGFRDASIPLDSSILVMDAEPNPTDADIVDAEPNPTDADIVDAGSDDAQMNAGDSGFQQDAMLPAIETGRIQCGDLTYSSLYDERGSLAGGWWFTGTTAFGNGQAGSCGGLGTEAVVEFIAPETGLYTVHLLTSTGSSPVLYVRRDCAQSTTETACAPSLSQIDRATIRIEASAGSKWYIFADTWQPSDPVDYQLSVHYSDQVVAPVVEAATLSTDTGYLQLKLEVSDQNADAISGRVQSVDEADSIEYSFTFENTDQNGTSIDAEFNLGRFDADATQWQIVITDQTGLDSEAFTLESSPTQTGAPGTVCGQSTLPIVLCAEGDGCDPDASGAFACTSHQAPQVLAFELFSTANTHDISAEIADPNSDLAFGLVELSSSTGEVIERHLFPVLQQSITTQLNLSFERQVAENAQTAQLTLTDETGQVGSSPTVTISAPQQLAAGANCSATEPSTQCAPDATCLRICEFDTPMCAPMCIEETLPSVESAKFIRNEPRNVLSISVAIEDVQRTFSRLEIKAGDGADTNLDLLIHQWQRTADTRLEGSVSIAITDRLHGLSSIQITPFTRNGNPGPAYLVDVQPPEEIIGGNRCDPTNPEMICPMGQACFSTTSTEMRCAASEPPRISQAELYIDNTLPYSGLRISGQTGDAPALSLLVRSIDPGPEMGVITVLPLEAPVDMHSNLEIAQRLPVADPVELEIAIQDARFIQSEWQQLMRIDTPSRLAGEVCLPDEVFGRCTDGTSCLVSDMDNSTCRLSPNGCPEEWNVDLIEEMDSPVVFNGDTRDGYASETGSCNFGGEGVIHGFTPHTNQLYVAKITPTEPSPIRYPRLSISSECGQAVSETGCTQTPSLAFMGQADRPAYITVSAPPISSDFPGTYDLDIYPHRIGNVQSLELSGPLAVEQAELTLRFTPGSEVVTSIALRVFDEMGNPMWSPVYGEEWTQSVFPMESNASFVASIQVDLASFESQSMRVIEITLIDALNIYSDSATVAIP